MDIVARWRGSVHDSRIWRESRIKSVLEATNLRGGVILGDNGYPCSRILLTPFRVSDTLSPSQQRYNIAHIKTRNIIERLFGQLKNKFRCCFNGIAVDLNTAKNMIVAIAVLHNIARERNIPFVDCDEIDNNEELHLSNENMETENLNISANSFKQQFIDTYFV